MTKKSDFYKRAGILDQARFYGGLYASGELLHPSYFQALERFHIRWARTMWLFDNVREGASLLDLGSGSGLLALLKRKGVKLAGVDLSIDCARATLRNGYDLVSAADLRALPFADATFDYVVSLDVLGHIEFDHKDAVIAEIRRVLKPDGVTLHGVEIMNSARRKDYHEMSEEELQHFIRIDGHVGMESQPATEARFARFFSYVHGAPRFSICQSAEELVKQADEYGVALCDEDLLDYLRNLSHNERRAFNMAMGYVFQQISDFGIQLPDSEYLFLKASNSRAHELYNEHRDRSSLSAQPAESLESLNETSAATFDGGWYPAEDFPPVGRWMGRRATIRFRSRPFARLSLTLMTHIPDVSERPLHVDLILNASSPLSLTLRDNERQTVELETTVPCENDEYELEISADRTWQPRPGNQQHRDDREISVAVFDIRIIR